MNVKRKELAATDSTGAEHYPADDPGLKEKEFRAPNPRKATPPGPKRFWLLLLVNRADSRAF